jgi:acetylornithine deacetylase/succinyl-diaminopimelate desuccinylase-like protein
MPLADAVLADWVARLVQVPSVNPLQKGPNSGVDGELALALKLAEEFERLGASEIVLDDVHEDRPNLYGFFPGRTNRLVVIDAHLDTVTVENMIDPPFDGRIEGGYVWGRGSLDTKASIGVICALIEGWQRLGLRPEPTLLVVGTVGEEAGGLQGARKFREWIESRQLVIDQMVICEPTNCAPIHGHKGAIGMRIDVLGKSAHSSVPEAGANAIHAAARVVVALEDHHAELVAGLATTEVGTGTLLTTSIHGGIAPNVVPDKCTLTVGRRIAPGEDPATEFERLSQIAINASPLPVEITSLLQEPGRPPGSPAFYQTPDSELVRVLSAATGERPACAPFGTNALRYDGFANQKVVFGPGSIDDAHKPTECVRIADLQRIAAAYEAWLQPV